MMNANSEKRAKNKEGVNNTESKLLSNAEMQISKRANLETTSWKEALRLAIVKQKANVTTEPVLKAI